MVDLSRLLKVESAQEVEKESELIQAIEYLKSTDWYAIMKIETGKEIPEDVEKKRSEARAKV